MCLQSCHLYNVKWKWELSATYLNVPAWKSMVLRWPRFAPWSPDRGSRAADGRDVLRFVLSGYRVIHCTHEAAELVCASFFPEVRSREIKNPTDIPNQEMVSNSLSRFFILAHINCLERFIVLPNRIPKPWLPNPDFAWHGLLCHEQKRLIRV